MQYDKPPHEFINGNSRDDNPFALFNSKEFAQATFDGLTLINDFFKKREEWEEKYQDLGAADTASHDAFRFVMEQRRLGKFTYFGENND